MTATPTVIVLQEQNETIVGVQETEVQVVETLEQSTVTAEEEVVTVVVAAEQGPTGAKGDKGDSGVGIDNFDSDPLVLYLLARG